MSLVGYVAPPLGVISRLCSVITALYGHILKFVQRKENEFTTRDIAEQCKSPDQTHMSASDQGLHWVIAVHICPKTRFRMARIKLRS